MPAPCSKKTHRLTGLLALLLALPFPARAQAPDSLSETATVSVLTILPGEALYSAWGHTAFRIRDPEQGIDWVFDYGTFNFDDPFFIPRFVYGRLDYLLSAGRFDRRLAYTAGVEHRPIIEQVLALSGPQRNALYHFLLTNYEPENRTYRYDFLFDNCSTRPRDVLEQTLGSEVQFAYPAHPPTTFRHMIDPYVADRPLLDFGFDLLLGSPTDRVVSDRERLFLPEEFLHALDGATVHEAGRTEPLVVRKDTLAWPETWRPVTPAFPWPVVLAHFVLVLGAYRTFRTWGAPPGRADRWLFGLTGALGMFMLFMWFGTEHNVTKGNWNILWALPSHLVAVQLMDRPRWHGLLRGYAYLAAGLTLFIPLGWFTGWPMAFHPAAVPLALFVGLRCLRLGHAPRPAATA